MSTTNTAFVVTGSAALVGTAVLAAPAMIPVSADQAREQVNGGHATRIDTGNSDLATNGYAKNGASVISLSGTTPVTVNLTNLATASTSNAGDTVFATVYRMIFTNLGAADLTIAPGGSNPANMQLGGTTPTITVAAGSQVTIHSLAGLTVDSTHKNITVTPSAGGTFAIAVGGA